MEFCKKALLSKKIWIRSQDRQAEENTLLTKKSDLIKAHEEIMKEIDLQLLSSRLERDQLIVEMNTLFEKVEVVEVQQEILDPRRPAHRHRKRWSEEEKDNIKKCITLILSGSSCSVHDLAGQLGVNDAFCASLIEDLLSKGTIRKVMVTVDLGVTATRKVQGYALALQEVPVAEKAA
jgi:transposase-like protein